MGQGSALFLDTYFNSISASRWFKYTQVSQIGVCLKLKGRFRISLVQKEKRGDRVIRRVAGEKIFHADMWEEVRLMFQIQEQSGIYAVRLLSLEDGSEFCGGYYFAGTETPAPCHVHISLIICTYRRESYVLKNIGLLREAFLDNRSGELSGRLNVMIADNGGTLEADELDHPDIHLFPNKNAGGSSGFARGMIETMRLAEGKKITHVLLMDDDVVILPEAIFRTYQMLTLLKEEYKDSFVGGAMLRTDKPWFQTESGARWNSGRLTNCKNGLDLRKTKDCLLNDQEDVYEYNAWWYCAIPMCFVREDNLPLPIFIRGDDVEYGLRNMKHLILLNGICVWHEPFEFKYSSSAYYYIFRNRLVVNAVRGQPYAVGEFWKEYKLWVRNEMFNLRYKNAWLLLRCIDDFLKGVDWMKQQDPEVLNGEIMRQGYRLEDISSLPIPFSEAEYQKTLEMTESWMRNLLRRITFNGIWCKASRTVVAPVQNAWTIYFFRAGKALNYDSHSQRGFVTYRSRKELLQLWMALRKMKRKVYRKYDDVREEYEKRQAELTGLEFWNAYLNCGGRSWQ
ncbi:MAG: glycosyltransferase [Clostridiales bacterium]|nr:glycosyltransferase [Clostridiales bacterium]